jgi:voltage-gated potassium channel
MVTQRLRAPLVVLTGVVSLGTAGYWLLGQGQWSLLDCAYMTVTTVATVGFGEILPVATVHGGRAFTLLLVVMGTLALWWFMASTTALLVQGELGGLRWRRRMESDIRKIRDHVVVCGAGATGIHCIRELAHLGTPFVVIDRVAEVAEAVTRAHGGAAVVGDATHDEVLEQAGVTRARGVISALTDDKDNLFVTITARALHPGLRIVAKAIEAKAEPKLRRAGADAVVSPNAMGGLRMVSEMVRPEVTSFLDVMLREKGEALRLEEVAVPRDSPWVGRPLEDLDLERRGLFLLAVRDPAAGGRFRQAPSPEEPVAAGAVLIVLGRPEAVRSLSQGAPPR